MTLSPLSTEEKCTRKVKRFLSKHKEFWDVWNIISEKQTAIIPMIRGKHKCFPSPGIIWQGAVAVFLLRKKDTTPQMHSHTSIVQTLHKDKWPRQSLNLAFESWCLGRKPFLRHNSLIEGRRWQAFFISWPLNTMALWLSSGKLCHARGSNYVPKEGRECTQYAYSMGGDYKEERCVRTSFWPSTAMEGGPHTAWRVAAKRQRAFTASLVAQRKREACGRQKREGNGRRGNRFLF